MPLPYRNEENQIWDRKKVLIETFVEADRLTKEKIELFVYYMPCVCVCARERT